MKAERSDLSVEHVLTGVEKNYRALFNSPLVGVAISDGDEHLYKVNDKFLHIIGYTRADFEQGKITWSSITPLKYDRLDRMKLSELSSYSYTDVFEKEYINKDGQSIPVAVGAELICNRPQVNITFVIDISKQRKAEKEKDEVIATIGHELKTPLSVLRVQAELLYREAEKGMTQKKLLKTLKEFDEHISQMDDIMTHILTHNRPMATAPVVSVKEFDVAHSLRKVISDIRLLTDRKVYVEKADKDCFIEGNEIEIREVIMNLISNALRYSPDNTEVRATALKEGDYIKVSIQDWGRGIRHADQKKIFQKNFQVRQPEGYVEKGSRGLGLYLCREIVKKHGGKIEVESKLGRGSVFTCIFKAPHLNWRTEGGNETFTKS